MTDVCSSAFLANVLKGYGVKSAYCNDKWLVITASGEAGGMYMENLDDVPYPPAKVRSGEASLLPTPPPPFL